MAMDMFESAKRTMDELKEGIKDKIDVTKLELAYGKKKKKLEQEQMEVEQNDTNKIGSDQSTEVGNDQSLKVGNDQSVQVGNDQTTTIGSNNTIQIGGDQTIDVKGNKDENVTNTSYLSAKDYREEIDNEIVVLAKTQQYKSDNFTKIDGRFDVDLPTTINLCKVV